MIFKTRGEGRVVIRENNDRSTILFYVIFGKYLLIIETGLSCICYRFILIFFYDNISLIDSIFTSGAILILSIFFTAGLNYFSIFFNTNCIHINTEYVQIVSYSVVENVSFFFSISFSLFLNTSICFAEKNSKI